MADLPTWAENMIRRARLRSAPLIDCDDPDAPCEAGCYINEEALMDLLRDVVASLWLRYQLDQFYNTPTPNPLTPPKPRRSL